MFTFLYIKCAFLATLFLNVESLDIFKENRQALSEGEEQFRSIQKLTVSSYGGCWLSAVTELKSSCPELTEKSHCRLAFDFANCFMEQMGFTKKECGKDISKCLKDFKSDMHWFTAYLQYHTHTHNMCYFLNHQLWLERTERTISRLAQSSNDISSQLEVSTRKQQKLLELQEESVNTQKSLVQESKQMSAYMEHSHKNMVKVFDDMEKTMQGQQSLVMDMLNKLSIWMQFLVDHMTSFYTLTFYLATGIAIFFVTSTPRTSRARVWLITLWISVLIIEFKMRFNYEMIWNFRYIALALSLAMLIFTGSQYQDFETLNNRILNDVYNIILAQSRTSQDIQAYSHSGLRYPFPPIYAVPTLKELDSRGTDSDSTDNTFEPDTTESDESSYFTISNTSSRSSTPALMDSSSFLDLDLGADLASPLPFVSATSSQGHRYNLRQRRSMSTYSVDVKESPQTFSRQVKTQAILSKLNSTRQVYINGAANGPHDNYR